MHETIQALRGNIRVFCRVRGGGGEAECAVSVPAGQVEDTVLEIRPVDGAKGGPQRFQFDHAFGAAASQEDVFVEACVCGTPSGEGGRCGRRLFTPLAASRCLS